MKKSVQLVIPEPCSENWNEMSPEENGRFCGKCQKTVVDFTGMSSLSILELMNNSSGEICGRILPSQMTLTVSQVTRQPEFSLRAVVLGLTLTTFCALHSCAQQEAVQGGIAIEQVEEAVKTPAGKNSLEHTVVVCNEAGDPIAYSVVYVTYDDGSYQAFQTDSTGIARFQAIRKVKAVYADNGALHLQSDVYMYEDFDETRNLVAILHDFNPPVMGKMILPQKPEKER